MSKEKNGIEVVKIRESELVKLIEGIVIEAVADKKKEWITEQKTKSVSLIEQKVAALEKRIAGLTKPTNPK